MRKSGITDADIDSLIEYTIAEEFGSYYRDRVSSSSNIAILRQYLKLVRDKKGADFRERVEIRRKLESLIRELDEDEHIEDFNTFWYVVDILVDGGAIEIQKDKRSGECKIIPLFSEEV